jgi:hypothetical protein
VSRWPRAREVPADVGATLEKYRCAKAQQKNPATRCP